MSPLRLRTKLLLLLTASVSAAVIAVGVELERQSRAVFEQAAAQRFDQARRVLVKRLQDQQQRAQERAEIIAQRADVIATVNLVNAYQSKQRYQPLVFDGEKRALAQALGTGAGGGQRALIAYDTHGDLVSFARADGDLLQVGYLSYDDGGKPLPYAARADGGEWLRLSTLPETCAEEDPAAASASGYGQCAGRFMLRAVAPIERRFPSGASVQVGRVVLSEPIGGELATAIGEESDTRVALYLHNRPLGGNLEVDFDQEMSRNAVPLLRDSSERRWSDGERYLIQPYSIALGTGLNAYVLIGVDKEGFNAQRATVRDGVVKTLVAALGGSLLLALGFAWLVERPARQVVQQLPRIAAGDDVARVPTAADGFGLVMWQAQELAQAQSAGSRAALAQSAHTAAEIVATLMPLLEADQHLRSGHGEKVAALAVAIAEELALPAAEVEGIRLAALLHDVGLAAVPLAILNRPTTVTAEERTVIQDHAKAGYDRLQAVQSPWPLALVALQHHERIDGSGYPLGLKGDDILLAARIVAVADTAAAMLAARPHRGAVERAQVIRELEAGRGTLFDAAVVDACVQHLRRPPTAA